MQFPAAQGSRAPRRRFIETLENRQLLANTISVVDFGAIANDGFDDSAAIQRAINASGPGDTITFGPGTFGVSNHIEALGGGRSLIGNGAVLRSGQNNYSLHFSGNGLDVSGFTFVGRGIFMDRDGNQMVEGVSIRNNTFAVDVAGADADGIKFTTGLRNSAIHNNTFTHAKGANNGIEGYNWDNLTISNNSFVNGNEGIHMYDFKVSSKDLRVASNYFSGLSRMGIEIQGGGANTIVEDNYYENPAFYENAADNGETFAYSIIADESTGTIVRRNAAIAPDRPDGTGVRIMFEIGGDGTLVEDNYSLGGNHVLASNDRSGTTTVLAQNNLFLDYLEAPSGLGLTLLNNGPDTQLSWDINRPIPGAHGISLGTGLLPEPSSALVVFVLSGFAMRRTARSYANRRARR